MALDGTTDLTIYQKLRIAEKEAVKAKGPNVTDSYVPRRKVHEIGPCSCKHDYQEHFGPLSPGAMPPKAGPCKRCAIGKCPHFTLPVELPESQLRYEGNPLAKGNAQPQPAQPVAKPRLSVPTPVVVRPLPLLPPSPPLAPLPAVHEPIVAEQETSNMAPNTIARQENIARTQTPRTCCASKGVKHMKTCIHSSLYIAPRQKPEPKPTVKPAKTVVIPSMQAIRDLGAGKAEFKTNLKTNTTTLVPKVALKVADVKPRVRNTDITRPGRWVEFPSMGVKVRIEVQPIARKGKAGSNNLRKQLLAILGGA